MTKIPNRGGPESFASEKEDEFRVEYSRGMMQNHVQVKRTATSAAAREREGDL